MAFALEPLVQRGAGKRDCDRAQRGRSGTSSEVDGLVEGVDGVVIESEDEAAHQRDLALADLADDFVVVAAHVERSSLDERLLIQRLEIDQQTAAAAFRCGVEQLVIHAMVVVASPAH